MEDERRIGKLEGRQEMIIAWIERIRADLDRLKARLEKEEVLHYQNEIEDIEDQIHDLRSQVMSDTRATEATIAERRGLMASWSQVDSFPQAIAWAFSDVRRALLIIATFAALGAIIYFLGWEQPWAGSDFWMAGFVWPQETLIRFGEMIHRKKNETQEQKQDRFFSVPPGQQ